MMNLSNHTTKCGRIFTLHNLRNSMKSQCFKCAFLVYRIANLAFNLWAVSLSLAIGVSVKALVHSEESLWIMVGIALASLLCCLLQFGLGRLIGRKHGEPVAGTQALGQKNTVFAIWMGYTFLDPVTALAGGFYSLWHNLVNSWQLWRVRKSLESSNDTVGPLIKLRIFLLTLGMTKDIIDTATHTFLKTNSSFETRNGRL